MKRALSVLMLVFVLCLFPVVGKAQDPTPFLQNPAWIWSDPIEWNAGLLDLAPIYFPGQSLEPFFNIPYDPCSHYNAAVQLYSDSFQRTGNEEYWAEATQATNDEVACAISNFGTTEVQLGPVYIAQFTLSPNVVIAGALKPHVIANITLNRTATGGGVSVHLDSQNDTILPYHNVVLIPAGHVSIAVDLGIPNNVNLSQNTAVHIRANGGTDAFFTQQVNNYVQFYASPTALVSGSYVTIGMVVNNFNPSTESATILLTQLGTVLQTNFGNLPALVLNQVAGQPSGTYAAYERVLTTSTSVPLSGQITASFRNINYRVGLTLQPYTRAGANGDVIYRYAGSDAVLKDSIYWGAYPVTGYLGAGHSFLFEAVHDGKALSIGYQSANNGDPLIQWDWIGISGQEWSLIPTSDGFFRIENINSHKDITVPYMNMDDMVSGLLQWDWSGLPCQEFEFVNFGSDADPQYAIINKWSGKSLNVPYGSSDNGTGIGQWDQGTYPSQLFRLYPLY